MANVAHRGASTARYGRDRSIIASMGKYYLQRIVRLNDGHSAVELEHLLQTGYLEMQRWMSGVERLTFARAAETNEARYVLSLTFASYEAYKQWRRVEEDGADFWERYAAIQAEWEEVCSVSSECAGDVVLEVALGDAV